MKTVITVLKLASDFLSKKGIKKSRLVADTLLAHYLKIKRIELYLQFDRPLEEEELLQFREGIKRASTHEPVDYILGELDFFGCRIKVGPGVLVPRPETEILFEHIDRCLEGSEKKALDLCTGSGCIAVALKTRHPNFEVFAVDLSPDALKIARTNHKEVNWLEGDLTAPVKGEMFDLVVCNPPYIKASEYRKLDLNIRQFEPKMALVAGESGLEFYKRLAFELPPILNSGSKVFFEIGSGQGESVKKIFSNKIWKNHEVFSDWAGHDRFFLVNS